MQLMERPRRRPEPAAIDITWVSCRGVKSTLPFHKPCLYASIFVVSSSAKNAPRRRHRVKTPTDRDGGENPEWDAPLRLYLPKASSSPEAADGKKNNKDDGGSDGNSSNSDVDDDILLLRFELKAEVAVLGDVHTASAAVPVPDLVADGRTRRVSYQLVGPDGRQANGVISFSYAFHDRNTDDDGQSSSSDGSEPATPSGCATPSASTAVAVPPPAIIAAAPRLYPEIDWALADEPLVYSPFTAKDDFAVANTLFCPLVPPLPTPSVEPASVYPPAPPVESTSIYPPAPASVYPAVTETSFHSVFPKVMEPAKTSALYPKLDLAPVSYYPPAPAHGVGFGYAAAPGWGDRCLYG